MVKKAINKNMKIKDEEECFEILKCCYRDENKPEIGIFNVGKIIFRLKVGFVIISSK